MTHQPIQIKSWEVDVVLYDEWDERFVMAVLNVKWENDESDSDALNPSRVFKTKEHEFSQSCRLVHMRMKKATFQMRGAVNGSLLFDLLTVSSISRNVFFACRRTVRVARHECWHHFLSCWLFSSALPTFLPCGCVGPISKEVWCVRVLLLRKSLRRIPLRAQRDELAPATCDGRGHWAPMR